MKRALFFFLAALLWFSAGASPADSLADRAALLAARGDIAALRPLLREAGTQFPTYVRLYCEMAVARADAHYVRMFSCIDSLTADYEEELGLKGRLALTQLKADGLCRLGRYADLAAYCREEEAYYKRRRVKRYLLAPIREYRRKGERLGGTSARARMLALADRDRAFELAAAYAPVRDSLDAFGRLRCDLTLASAFHRPERLLACTDSLLALYADSLDATELTFCLNARARTLIERGAWADLAAFARSARRLEHAHAAPLRHYERIGETLAALPPSRMERPAEETTVPVTYEWPLLVKAVAGRDVPRFFTLETGQPYTYLPEAEARQAGMTIVPDTIRLSTSAGMVAACPAFAERLALGNIVFHNLLVYSVVDTARLRAPFSRVIGSGELLRIGKFRLFPEIIQIPAVGTLRAGTDAPTSVTDGVWWPEEAVLRLSRDRTLRLRAFQGGRERLFSLDTSFPDNVMSRASFRAAGADSLQLDLLGRRFPVPVTWSDVRLPGYDGLLGAAFLQNAADSVVADFRLMTLKINPAEENAQAAGAFAPAYDGFYFERNRAALEKSEAGDLLLTYARFEMLRGKNRSDSLLSLCQTLREVEEAGDPYVRTAARCLYEMGRYADGGQLVAQEVRPEAWGGAEVRTEWADLFRGLSGQPAASLTGRTGQTVLHRTAEGLWPVSAGDKEMEARIDGGELLTVVSHKAAKRMKVRRLVHTADGGGIGVIPELNVGRFTFHDLPCRIAAKKAEGPVPPDARTGLLLGYDVLHRFAWVAFSPSGDAVFSLDSLSRTGGVSLRHADGLMVQGEVPTGYVSVSLVWDFASSAPAEGFLLTVDGRELAARRSADEAARAQLTLGQLAAGGYSAVFDFRHMRFLLRPELPAGQGNHRP